MDTALLDVRSSVGDSFPAVGASPVPVLKVQELKKSFDGTTQVLCGVNLMIAPGEAVCLIGANGSGKSTLMRCCMRLIEPDAGRIDLFGHTVSNLGRRHLRATRAGVGFVFQRHNLVPRLSVLSNVLHGAQARQRGPRVWLQGFAAAADREEAMHCLEQVGLAHLAGRRVDGLSGGQSQRVAIARALMQRPRIVMADEPVASLDPNAGEEVMDLFVDLIRRSGLTLFHSSHHLDHAVRYADRVLGLKDGRIALEQNAANADPDYLRGIYD